jgi:hypothetical protein
VENEGFYGEWDTLHKEESGRDMTELESNYTEADEAASIERWEMVAKPSGRVGGPEEEQSPPEEAAPTDRSLQERRLQQYQEMEKARVPELLGRILTSEYTPKPRHKIDGELGRKGRRGL